MNKDQPEDNAFLPARKAASGPGVLPDCRQCRHFFITHDPSRPMGCRAYGFKSTVQPSRVVWTSSGLACQLFAGRPAK